MREVFCFQFLVGGIREGLYPEKGGRLTGQTRIQLTEFTQKSLVIF